VITAIYDEKKEPIGFVKVTRDLTERKQAEQALAASERNYRALASMAPVGIFECTPESHLTYINDYACQVMGLPLEEALGKGWLNAIHPDDREMVMNEWYKALGSGEAFTLEYRFYHPKNDKTLWIINQASPKLNKKGRVKSYIQTVTDITARKRLEEAENNQKRLKEFIDTICHEIRNPLNGMAGSTQMLKETLDQLKSLLKSHDKMLTHEVGEQFTYAFEALNDIYESLGESVQQQKIVVDDVLDVSKIEHNTLTLKIDPFSPKRIILTSVQIFSAQFKQKGLQLDLKLPDKETIVEGDGGRLKQSVINLLSNALKFTLKGTIAISLTEQRLSENTVELTIQVTDTGIGMDQEEIKQLFKRFTQFGSSSSSQTYHPMGSMIESSGLGLSISQKLIELMGGHIRVTSEKDKGTEITITVSMPLSLIPKLPRTFSPIPMVFEGLSQRKVLIVDDNPVNQRILINHVKPLGWEHQVAETGLEAFSASEEKVFDVILMDIEMPVMTGLEATRQIRQRDQAQGRKSAIIVGVSANAHPRHIKTAKEAGMDDYITKPVHKATLLNLLQKLVRSPSSAQTPSAPDMSSVSSLSSLPAARLPFFQAPRLTQSEMERLILQFKAAAKELLAQQLSFNARCENKYITIELPSLTPYFRKFVFTQFKQLVEQVFQDKAVKAKVTDNYLRLTTYTAEEALHLKIILSEAGLANAFNKPRVSQAEIPSPPSQVYSN
ncbi:MAG: hypothetical protein K0R12_438, partial [Gammaproteobacteria bacterium]|jgi:PAS domain S-box-containing protein|nr:hypothetical protein [Gammaproteobacteria bacterium]